MSRSACVASSLGHPLLLGMLLVVPMLLCCYRPLRIHGYHGDGSISALRFLSNPGVQVDFESFSLTAAYKASYRLDGLPKHRFGYRIGLLPTVTQADHDQSPHEITDKPGGSIRLRLEDGTGRILFDTHSSLDQLNWTWVRHERLGQIYPGVSSTREQISEILPDEFLAAPHDPRSLVVEYEPGQTPPDVMARLRLTAGGIK